MGDDFKCRICGFVVIGENSSTEICNRCLSRGNIMGDDHAIKESATSNDVSLDEPAINESATSNDVSLLENCNNCNHQFSIRASACPKCNHERTSECFVCKKQIVKSSAMCPECGDPAPFEQATEKTKTIVPKKNDTGGDFNQKVRTQQNGTKVYFYFIRALLTAVAFLVASVLWMAWQEFMPPGPLSWIIGVLISLSIVFGTWNWTKRFDLSRKIDA